MQQNVFAYFEDAPVVDFAEVHNRPYLPRATLSVAHHKTLYVVPFNRGPGYKTLHCK